MLGEYQEIITQKTTATVSENLTNFIVSSPYSVPVHIYFKWALIYQDGDDNKFVDCALNGQAEYLVTDDRHFRILSQVPFPTVKIIRTKDFLSLVKSLP